MSLAKDLHQRLNSCPAGQAGWREYEEICTEILSWLFVPPLNIPRVQPRTQSGVDRRDAVFPNRNRDNTNNWGGFYTELNARLILVEFKNYDATEIGKVETNQLRNYMTMPMGKLGILCCNKMPNKSAHTKRNTIFSEDGKVILFVTSDHLTEMINFKERGDDPSDLIVDMVEEFYLQHE